MKIELGDFPLMKFVQFSWRSGEAIIWRQPASGAGNEYPGEGIVQVHQPQAGQEGHLDSCISRIQGEMLPNERKHVHM